MNKEKPSRKNMARKDTSRKNLSNPTGHKLTQQASLHTEAMLVEAQRIFHIGSWSWDLATGKIQFSEEMFRIVGMFPGEVEITREVFIKFLHPDEAEEILHEFQHNASHPFSSIEHRIVLPNGEIRIAHTRVKAYKDENGHPLQLLGSTQDITERRHTEEALQIAEADYRAIFEGAPVGIFRSTVEGHFVKVNQTMAKMYGYESSEEMIADVQSIAAQMYAEPMQRKEFSLRINEHGEVLGFESLNRHTDGSAFWTSMNARMVKSAHGEIAYYEGFVVDITTRKQSEVALQKANEQLRAQLDEIKELQKILHNQAIHDSLTGLYNRRYMQEAIAQEHARAAREGYPISFIVLDLDNLKEINIKYGHFTGGDIALQVLGEHLKAMSRTGDITCRHGGDEFLIALHNTSAQVAYQRAEQWRKSLVEIDIDSEGTKFNISFSAGIATFPVNGKNVEEVMQAADKALYRAKGMGRNCVAICSD